MITHYSLSFPVYERLKEMIFSNELKPGQKLLQEKLAKELGVSRTPLMEALHMLEFDFLVESVPRRGMFVKTLTTEEMKDIYEVREGVECVAIRLVTERNTEDQLNILKQIWEPFTKEKEINEELYSKADEIFHAFLLEFSNNKILKRASNLSFLQNRILHMGLIRPPSETLPEHLEMLDAIEKGDSNRAEILMKVHIRKSGKLIGKKLKK